MLSYEHIRIGQEFIETKQAAIVGYGRRQRKQRTVIVMKTEVYWAEVKIIDGPGHGRTVRVWYKQLCNDKLWHFIDPGNAKTVVM